jgi:hypothetical protein
MCGFKYGAHLALLCEGFASAVSKVRKKRTASSLAVLQTVATLLEAAAIISRRAWPQFPQLFVSARAGRVLRKFSPPIFLKAYDWSQCWPMLVMLGKAQGGWCGEGERPSVSCPTK